MATWNDLSSYIRSNYQVSGADPNQLSMIFDTGGGRTQQVVVMRAMLEGAEWAVISTAVAQQAQVDPRGCLEMNWGMVVGGLAFFEDLVVFRHSFPLADLDVSEFEVPLRVAVTFGDQLEQQITAGADRF